ncbi:hypothetical protein [Streptomyces sp. NPDC088146]
MAAATPEQASTLLPLAPATADEALAGLPILAMLTGHSHPVGSVA